MLAVSGDNEQLRFLDLPLDALQAIARQLVCDGEREHRCCASALAALQAVQHLCTTCAALNATCSSDELLWNSLLAQRRELSSTRCNIHRSEQYPGLCELPSTISSSQTALGRLRADALAALDALPKLTPDPSAAYLCSRGMALSPCSTISLSMPTSNAVEIEKWQDVEGLVRRQLNSHVAPADALAWLLREEGAYPEGSPDALTQLAVLSALRAMVAPDGCWGPFRGVATSPLAEQLARLGPALLPEHRLATQLEVKRYSWSQLRDCRGFRARDDVAVRASPSPSRSGLARGPRRLPQPARPPPPPPPPPPPRLRLRLLLTPFVLPRRRCGGRACASSRSTTRTRCGASLSAVPPTRCSASPCACCERRRRGLREPCSEALVAGAPLPRSLLLSLYPATSLQLHWPACGASLARCCTFLCRVDFMCSFRSSNALRLRLHGLGHNRTILRSTAV